MHGRVLRPRAVVVAAILIALVFPAAAPAVTVWAVGDGGVSGPEDDALGDMIDASGPFDRFLYLGDVYETGTASDFQNKYDPAFGAFKQFTSPTPGNHEWDLRAEGYDPYWGPLAPQTNGGHWYAFDLGGWHFVSLNSMEDEHNLKPEQVAWLEQDLAGYAGDCTIAFFHHPRWSAAPSGDRDYMEPFWAELPGRAVIALTGHDHSYQRFKPQDGVVQFVVGSGGRGPFHDVDETDARLDGSNDTEFGALRLELLSDRADFQFVTTAGEVRDSGSIPCRPHSTPPPPPPGPGPGPGGAPGPGTTPPPLPTTPALDLSIASPRHRASYSRRFRRFRGAGPEGEMRLTLVRKRRGRCTWFNDRRFRRASCRTRRSVEPERDEADWSYKLPRRKRLKVGSYRLTVRMGAAETETVRFKIKR